MDAEETNSGLKKEGDMEEIADFAEKVEEGLQHEISEETRESFEEWRPQKNDTEKEMKEKTVKEASIKQKEVEENSEGLTDLSEAGRKIREDEKIVPEKGKVIEASKQFLRPVRSGSRKLLRKIEEEVYSKMMTPFNPYFFDSREVSANLKSEGDEEFSFEVNVPDRDKRRNLKSRIEESDS